jgi:hypothetical protein
MLDNPQLLRANSGAKMAEGNNDPTRRADAGVETISYPSSWLRDGGMLDR